MNEMKKYDAPEMKLYMLSTMDIVRTSDEDEDELPGMPVF